MKNGYDTTDEIRAFIIKYNFYFNDNTQHWALKGRFYKDRLASLNG